MKHSVVIENISYELEEGKIYKVFFKSDKFTGGYFKFSKFIEEIDNNGIYNFYIKADLNLLFSKANFGYIKIQTTYNYENGMLANLSDVSSLRGFDSSFKIHTDINKELRKEKIQKLL